MDASELSRAQSVIWIREQCRDSERSCRRTHLAIGGVNLALERIEPAIGENELNLQLAQPFIAVALSQKKSREIDVRLLGNVKVNLDRIHGRNGRQFATPRSDEITNLAGRNTGQTVNR